MARLDRLQPVKEVAQTAAVIGRSFDHRTIAALAALPEAELADAMHRLVEAELVFRRGTPPDATYLFKHALVRDAAYESLLKARRITMHARLLDVLENGGDAAPEVKAQHAEAAGLAERALDYWEQAGTQALARPAYKEAIASLENGVRLCGALGDDLQWKRREQGLHLQLGQALIANQGYQAPATLRAFERAMVLADEIGDVSLQLPAAYGQWVAPYIVGTGSGELAQRYAALAETQPETGPRLVGLRMLGLERFHEGRFKESLALMTKACDGYDPIAHRDLALRFGHDPRAASANYQAWNLWLLGFPDQARARSRKGCVGPARSTTPTRPALSCVTGPTSRTYGCVGRIGSKAARARRCDLPKTTRWPSGMLLRSSISAGPCRSRARRRASTRSRLACARRTSWVPAGSNPSISASPPTPMPAPAGMTKPGRASARRSQPSLMAATWLSPPSFIACGRCCRLAAVRASATPPRRTSAAR